MELWLTDWFLPNAHRLSIGWCLAPDIISCYCPLSQNILRSVSCPEFETITLIVAMKVQCDISYIYGMVYCAVFS